MLQGVNKLTSKTSVAMVVASYCVTGILLKGPFVFLARTLSRTLSSHLHRHDARSPLGLVARVYDLWRNKEAPYPWEKRK